MGRSTKATARRNPSRARNRFHLQRADSGISRRSRAREFAATIAQFGKTPQSLAEGYTGVAILIEAAPLSDLGALRDPKDAFVLACTVAARADAIVSGDTDLGVLESFRGIPILTPAQCLEHMPV